MVTGLSANDPVPGLNLLEVNLGAGAASLGATQYSVLLMGNMTTGVGSPGVIYGPDTTTPMTSEADAIALFGSGSELHRGVRAFLEVNTTSSLYVIAVPDSGGADGYLAVAMSGAATASGALRIWVGEEFVDTSIVTGDSTTAIAAAAAANINGKTHWAVTALASGGGLQISCKQSGPRGNDIRVLPQIIGNSIGVTVSPTVSTALSGGATLDDNTAALAAIEPDRFYYIVSAASDATQVGALLSQVNTQALPLNGNRQRVFCGSVASLASAITFGTGLNGARAEVAWMFQADRTPFELACSTAAAYSLREASFTSKSCNFDSFGLDEQSKALWKVKKPLSGAKPTRTQLKSALNNGLTPIAVSKSGATYIVSRATSKSQSASLPDYRIRDGHKVSVCDFFADDLILSYIAQFSGKLIGDDPVDNAPAPGPDVITPRVVKACVAALVDVYADRDLLQNRDQIKAGIQVKRGTAPTTRFSVVIPLQTCDLLHQIETSLNQVA